MPRRRVIYQADDMIVCPLCNGVGQVLDPDDLNSMMRCPLCNGEGRVHRHSADYNIIDRYRARVGAAMRDAGLDDV